MTDGLICPECRDGKHGNCNGHAWDEASDALGACSCGTTGAHWDAVRAQTEQAARSAAARRQGLPDWKPIKGGSYWGRGEEGVTSLSEDDQEAITELLMGRKVTKVDDDHLLLDDGTVLKAIGHEGGCSWSGRLRPDRAERRGQHHHQGEYVLPPGRRRPLRQAAQRRDLPAQRGHGGEDYDWTGH